VTDHRDVSETVAKIVQELGTIDILVSTVGWTELLAPEEYSAELYVKIRSINLDGMWNVCQAVMPEMMRKRTGKIVLFSAGAALLGYPKNAPYAAAKAGVAGLTRALAVDLAPYQINVNCICPGTTVTPLLAATMDKITAEREIAEIPLHRFGQPSDHAKAALFLASADSDWITGVLLPVDGGWSCCFKARDPL
jgi:NAD(P)-dependent dehydrogenase (short-subunit alcohol dehydrogenase family)